MNNPNEKNKKDEKDEKDEKENDHPLPPGTPDRTPIESPDVEKPIGDPQPKENKTPRM